MTSAIIQFAGVALGTALVLVGVAEGADVQCGSVSSSSQRSTPLLIPTAAEAVAADGRWDNRFTRAGLGHDKYEATRFVAATATHVYVAGTLRSAAELPVSAIAAWDGTDWSSVDGGLGSSFSPDDGGVFGLAVGDTSAYIIGNVYELGGVLVDEIAMWDGSAWYAVPKAGLPLPYLTTYDVFAAGNDVYHVVRDTWDSPTVDLYRLEGDEWSPVAEDIDGTIAAVTMLGDEIIVAGSFSTIDGVAAANVARWNGAVWSPLGSGTNASIDALAAVGATLYATGSFTSAGGHSAEYIAQWDGLNWAALGAGLDHAAFDLAAIGTNLYVAGYFTTAGGIDVSGTAMWNGSEWSPLGDGLPEPVRGLATLGADLYALSGWNLFKWDGLVWTDVADGMGIHGEVQSLDADESGVYAGGLFSNAGDTRTGCIAGWNASDWHGFGSGVCGYLPGEENEDRTFTAVAKNGARLYVADDAGLINEWDGSSWNVIRYFPGYYWAWGSAYALAFYDGHLLAGGDFTAADLVTPQYLLEWDGVEWSPFAGDVNGPVRALEVVGDDLYVAGEFTGAGGVPASRIAKWDGEEWSSLGKGTNGPVRALAIEGAKVYAGGEFAAAGCAETANVAMWDGQEWWPLGDGTDEMVHALAVIDNDLYAGGWFGSADGLEAHYIARWDGSQWWPLGSGTNGPVNALAALGTDLYVGGRFSKAGPHVSRNIAIWHTQLGATSTTLPPTSSTTTSLPETTSTTNDSPTTSVTIATSTTTSLGTETTTTTRLLPSECGDANGDGEVTATDALVALTAAVGLHECALLVCDVNGSGSVSATDALAILNAAVGLPIELSCTLLPDIRQPSGRWWSL